MTRLPSDGCINLPLKPRPAAPDLLRHRQPYVVGHFMEKFRGDGIGDPRVSSSAIIFYEQHGTSRPDKVHEVAKHGGWIGDEMQCIGQENAVEERQLEPVRKVALDYRESRTLGSAHRSQVGDGASIAVHRPDRTIRADDIQQGTGECARAGAQIGPALTPTDTGFNQSYRFLMSHRMPSDWGES